MPSLTSIGTLIFYRKELTEGEILWKKYLKNEKVTEIPEFQHPVEEEEEDLNAIRNFRITNTKSNIIRDNYEQDHDYEYPPKIDVSDLLCAAATCVTKRDVIGALLLCTEALVLSGESQKYDVYVKRSECLSRLQEYDKALADSQQAIKYAKGKVSVSYQQCVSIFINLGQLEDAENVLDQHPEIFKNSEKYKRDMQSIRNILDDVNENLTDFEYCLRIIDEGLKIAPHSLEFLSLKIKFLVLLKRLEEAKTVDQVIAKRCGKFLCVSETFNNYYNGYFERCNFETISKNMNVKFINEMKDKLYDVKINFELVNTKLNTKNYKEAIPILHDLLNCDDFNQIVRLKIYKMFITCYSNLPNQDDNLIKYASIVLEKETSNVKIRIDRAKAYANIKSHNKALDDLNIILKSSISDGLRSQVTKLHNDINKTCELENEKLRRQQELEREKQDAAEKARNEETKKKKEATEQSLNKKRAESLNERANAQYKAGQYGSAILLYTDAIKLSPKIGKYYTNRSACYMGLCDYERALADAIKAVDIDPSYWKGYLRAINCFLIVGNITQAKSFIDKMQNNIPVIDSIEFNEVPKLNELEKYDNQISKLILENDYAECLKYLEKALKIAKECKTYKFLTAECLVMLGQYSEAKKFISRYANEPHMIYLKGLIAFLNENFDESLKLFKEALRLDPDLKIAIKYRDLAKSLKKFNDELKGCSSIVAIDVYTRILSYEHINSKIKLKAYVDRAEVYYKLQKYEKAFDDCSIALRLEVPNANNYHVRALIYRAKIHLENKEFDFAIIDCEEALKLTTEPIHVLQAESLRNDAKFKSARQPVKNYFDILQIPKNASFAVVKEAFKNLSKRFHSDKHPDATPLEKKKLERKFQEVRTAYECLRVQLEC